MPTQRLNRWARPAAAVFSVGAMGAVSLVVLSPAVSWAELAIAGQPSTPAASRPSGVSSNPLPAKLVPTTIAPPQAVPSSPLWAERSKPFGGYEWVTRPSRDAVMGFTIPMEVEQIVARAGQSVKTGDVLVKGREGEALAALSMQRVRAENRGPIDASKAQLELAEIRFEQAKKARQDEAMTVAEFDERRVSVDSSKASLVNAEANLREEQERLKQAQQTADKYVLRARFDGVVEVIATDAGQAVDIQQPVIRVVQVDPLWVDVPVPTDDTLTGGIKTGSQAWVMLDLPHLPTDQATLAGSVLYISPVVDASGSRRVRVEVKNPSLWPAGTRTRVRFTPPTAAPVSGTTKAAADSKPAPIATGSGEAR